MQAPHRAFTDDARKLVWTREGPGSPWKYNHRVLIELDRDRAAALFRSKERFVLTEREGVVPGTYVAVTYCWESGSPAVVTAVMVGGPTREA